MIGIVDAKSIGSVVPLDNGKFFLEKGGNSVLRPNWSGTWQENSEWHDFALTFLTTKGPQLHVAMTANDLEKRSDSSIFKRLQTLYKTFQKQYQKIETPEEAKEKEKLGKRTARHKQQKIKVGLLHRRQGGN